MTKDPVQEWFSQPKLGLFLHFGLYSIEAWHEQDQMRRRIPRSDYEKLIARFNPSEFDPDAILDLAQRVGMEYVCLTTKHHDGFCLWDTKQTDFNVMNSPYGKDVVKQLADACHKRNFPLGLYYSVVDWYHPNYPNQGRHHEIEGPEPGDEPNWDAYMEYLKAQVAELCTNYGEVRHFFWDMNVPEHVDPGVNAMLRELQPTMVINDRGFDDGDFGTPEREYNQNETERTSRFRRPTEACNSVGTQSWGYREDEDYYTVPFLIQSIDGMMAKGAHYLLNVGPDASGRVPETATEILLEIGDWYTLIRESFTDAEPCSDLTKNGNVLLTRRGNVVYVHLKHPITSDAVILNPISDLPVKAQLLNTLELLDCTNTLLPSNWKENTPVLRVRGIPRQAITSNETLVIKLEFDHDPFSDSRA